jgi:hypothetical protein
MPAGAGIPAEVLTIDSPVTGRSPGPQRHRSKSWPAVSELNDPKVGRLCYLSSPNSDIYSSE